MGVESEGKKVLSGKRDVLELHDNGVECIVGGFFSASQCEY